MLPTNPSLVREEEKPDLHDYVSLNNNWEVKIIPSVTSMTLAQTISMQKVTRMTRKRKMLLVYRQTLCHA